MIGNGNPTGQVSGGCEMTSVCDNAKVILVDCLAATQ